METLSIQQSLRFRETELSARVHESASQKLFRISAFSAGIVLFSGVFMFNIQNPVIVRSSKSLAYATPTTQVALAASDSSSSTPTILGINIANNGLVFVRGARVTSITDDKIQASMSWGYTDFAWTIETSGLTKFLNNKGQKQTVFDIKVGDIIVVTGKLVGDNNQLTINAEFVRNK